MSLVELKNIAWLEILPWFLLYRIAAQSVGEQRNTKMNLCSWHNVVDIDWCNDQYKEPKIWKGVIIHKEPKISKGVISKELALLLLGKIINFALMLESSVRFVISSWWKFDPYEPMFDDKYLFLHQRQFPNFFRNWPFIYLKFTWNISHIPLLFA